MWRDQRLLSGVAQIAFAYSDREDPLCSTSHSGSFRFETVSRSVAQAEASRFLEQLPERFADQKQLDSKPFHPLSLAGPKDCRGLVPRIRPQRQRFQCPTVRFVLRP